MDLEEAQYITRYYANFFTKEESLAWRHWSTKYKLDHGTYEDEEQRERRKNANLERGWMTEDPSILELLTGGIDQFNIRTAQRILHDHEKEVFLNRCEQCKKLARTPKAKQCRFCGNDWH